MILWTGLMRSVERGVSVPNILCTRCEGEKEGEAGEGRGKGRGEGGRGRGGKRWEGKGKGGAERGTSQCSCMRHFLLAYIPSVFCVSSNWSAYHV